jgi:hypothetical protein
MQHNWLELARIRWPQMVVGGSGRFALYSPAFEGAMGKVLLFETRAKCEAQIVDPKHAFCIDLMPPPAPPCMNRRDDYEDRQWEKRFGK